MEESKLTMLQRKTIQEAVDKGESLPPPIDRTKKDTDNIEDNRVNISHNVVEKFSENDRKIISCSVFR